MATDRDREAEKIYVILTNSGRRHSNGFSRPKSSLWERIGLRGLGGRDGPRYIVESGGLAAVPGGDLAPASLDRDEMPPEEIGEPLLLLRGQA